MGPILLDTAVEKLAKEKDHEPFPLEALPKNPDDTLWQQIQQEYNLTLPELSCLKNYAAPPRPDIVHMLEEAKGSPLSASEIEYAFLDHAQLIDYIEKEHDAQERSRMVNHLWKRVSVHVKTKTRLAIKKQYLFGGALHGGDMMLGPGTELQFVAKGSSLYCAKIMTDTAALEREYSVAKKIHESQTCPTVMPVLDVFQLPGKQQQQQQAQRSCMITPYYPLSLSDFCNGELSEEGCINVAICGLASIRAFSVQCICHGDMKPANMMFTGFDNLVITIDFGSAVGYGEPLTSVTAGFGLDHSVQKGSLTYDLTCLASSIYMFATGQQQLPETSDALVEQLEQLLLLSDLQGALKRPSLQIAKSCLQLADIDSIRGFAISYIDAALPSLNQSLLVSFDSVWPSSRST